MEKFCKTDAHNLWWITLVKPIYRNERGNHLITVLIKDQWAVKTDGARIHAALISRPVRDGCYHVIKRSRSKMWIIRDESIPLSDWPEWIVKSIFPIHDEKTCTRIFMISANGAAYKLAQYGVMLNLTFLQDVFRDKWNYDWVKYPVISYEKEDTHNPIIFQAPDERLAVIMQMRKDEIQIGH